MTGARLRLDLRHHTDFIKCRAKTAPVDWADRSPICFSELDDRHLLQTDNTDWSAVWLELKQMPRKRTRKRKSHYSDICRSGRWSYLGSSRFMVYIEDCF